MSSAKITLFSFARWMRENEKDLFSELTTPPGIEKATLVDNILLRGGEFEVVYSDPDFMQYAIGSWSRKWYRTMEKWIMALSIDYNPLENYDRYETFQDNSNKTNNLDRTLDHQDLLTINTQDLLTLNTQDLLTHNTEDKTLINTQDLRTLDTQNKETKDLADINLRNLKDLKSTEGETTNLRNLQDVDVINSDETTTYDHTTTQEQLVSAYDSSSYQPSSKTINTDGEISGGDILHNTVGIDRSSKEEASHTGTEKANSTGTEETSYTGTESATHTGTDTTENTGTDTLNRTGTETTGKTGTETTGRTGTETTGRTGTETTGHTGTIKDVGGEDAISLHAGHTHGNIGVTTTQQMLQQELDISKWNIYENITDLFLTEFVIPIYT